MAVQTLRDSLLTAATVIRGIPGSLGLRRNPVTMRIRTWTGNRVGQGTYTDVDASVTVDGLAPRVRLVSAKDSIASGGKLTSLDVKVGALTPDFSSNLPSGIGGQPETAINPATSTSPQEVVFRIDGPGMAGGRWFVRVYDETLPNFSRFLYLRAANFTP